MSYRPLMPSRFPNEKHAFKGHQWHQNNRQSWTSLIVPVTWMVGCRRDELVGLYLPKWVTWCLSDEETHECVLKWRYPPISTQKLDNF